MSACNERGLVAGRSRRAGAVFAALALLLACGDSEPREGALAREQSAGARARKAEVIDEPACELSRPWRSCSVADRLERAGLAPVAADTVRHPALSVPGQSYRLGRAELHVFLYPDSTGRARDVARLDSATAFLPGAAVVWPARPTLITSDNLAAILLSDSERHIERVRDALTAGLPPP